MSSPASTVTAMDTRDLFLASDAALRTVIDGLTPADLERAVPAEWSSGHRSAALTLRDVVARHAYDEAWVPDVVAGRTIEEVGDRWSGDLLGTDPIASYDALNDAATAAVSDPALDPTMTIHFGYGDYPFSEGMLHPISYRAFQAWQIGHLLGTGFRLSPELIEGLDELLLPIVPELRQYGVFPPAIEPPADADAETRLLCAVGFWVP